MRERERKERRYNSGNPVFLESTREHLCASGGGREAQGLEGFCFLLWVSGSRVCISFWSYYRKGSQTRNREVINWVSVTCGNRGDSWKILLYIQSHHLSLAFSDSTSVGANIFQSLKKYLGSSAEPYDSVQQESISVFCLLPAWQGGLEPFSSYSRSLISNPIQRRLLIVLHSFCPSSSLQVEQVYSILAKMSFQEHNWMRHPSGRICCALRNAGDSAVSTPKN